MPSVHQHYEQLLGLVQPWEVSSVTLDPDNVKLCIYVSWPSRTKVPCPVCGTLCPVNDHREERSWRHLDTMQFQTIITCRMPRSACPTHGVKSIHVPWASDQSRFTMLFEHFAIDVIHASKSTVQAMGILRLSWDQVHRIREAAVRRGIARRTAETFIHVGIDEKNFGKGHSYISLLTDLDRGKVLDVVKDRTTESAKELWDMIPDRQKQTVQAVAMDMWDAFMTATKEAVPNAAIVHDKYHVATYLGKAVDAVRRKENNALAKAGNDALKGTKYLWLTNPSNWSKEAKKTFRSFAIDEMKVGRAWSIKEAFRHFWEYAYQGSAQSFFRRWYFWATHSKLKPVIDAAKTLKRHLTGMLTYVKHRITNATTEGLNSKIQSIKANARGFRNFEYYRIAILFHCGKLSMYP